MKRTATIAIYPGTFDPITLGHVDIARRAAGLVDRVVLAVSATNSGKRTVFTVAERTRLARESLAGCAGVEVADFDCLVVELAKRMGARFLVRGLRAVSDFDFEFQLAGMNRELMPELETLFLMPAQRYIFLSSSIVRELAALGGDVSTYVPEPVQRALAARKAR